MNLRQFKRLLLSLLFFHIFLFSFFPAFSEESAAGRNFHSVSYVIDGDTVVAEGDEKVRYLGIDTPEKDEYFFREARDFNIRMVMGKKVRLDFCSEQERDKYGRLLATVFVDGTDICGELVKNGYARTLAIPPCGKDKYAEYAMLQKSAILNKSGLWQKEKIVDAADAGDHIGEKINVVGRVVSFYRGRKAVFFNFGKDFRKDFSIVIFSKHLGNFKNFGVNPERDYPGRRVMVRGGIKEYNGPEIVAVYPSDIEILD